MVLVHTQTHTLHACGKHLHTKVPLILGSCNSLQCLETKLRKLLVQFQQYPDTNRIQWGDTNHIRVSYQIKDRYSALLRWLVCLCCS